MRHKIMTGKVKKTVAFGLTAIMLATCAGEFQSARAAGSPEGAQTQDSQTSTSSSEEEYSSERNASNYSRTIPDSRFLTKCRMWQ